MILAMRRRRCRWALALVLMVAPMAASGRASAARAPGDEPAARVEDAARALGLSRPAVRRSTRDFALTLIDGAAFRLADQRGKALILNFWATWCAPCVEEMPALERLWRAHRDRGLALLAVSIDVKGANLSRFLKTHKLALPVGADPQSKVASAFSVRSLPTTIVLDVEGRIVAVALGPRAWDGPAARALVGALLAERRQ